MSSEIQAPPGRRPHARPRNVALMGGLGGVEAATFGLLVLEGLSFEVALAATALILVTMLWFAILIGLGIFSYAKAKPLKPEEAS